MEQNQLYIYSQRDPISDNFLEKEPQVLLKEHLSQKEIELLGIGTKKKKLLHVSATDFQLLESIKNGNGKEIKDHCQP